MEPVPIQVDVVQIDITALEQLPPGAGTEPVQPLAQCGQVTCDRLTCQGTCRYTD